MIERPEKTCALVVGIGSYDLGKDRDLPGAIAGAQRFAAWLKSRGVGEKRIYLTLDPKADQIFETLGDIKKECKDFNTVIVYWAGHGFETGRNQRGLFVKDTAWSIVKAIDVDTIVAYLSNETPQFKRQFLWVDACATRLPSPRVRWESVPIAEQTMWGGAECRFVFAAPTGRETLYPVDGKPSVFTERVLELLDTPGLGIDGVLAALQKDYPIAVRDHRSKYWSENEARTHAWELEAEACRIREDVDLEDAKWRAVAKRLEGSIDMPNATFREIVAKIAGMEPSLAGRLCAALLLRGGEIAERDVSEEIRASALLRQSYDAAAEMVAALKAFENPSYLIWTDYLANGDLGAKSAWFFPGDEDTPASAVEKWDQATTFRNAVIAVADHMSANDVSAESVIHVAAPLQFLLTPSMDMLKTEADYPLVYRERTRAVWNGEFRTKQPKFRDRLRDVKRRAALQSRWLQWFDPADCDLCRTVEFPAVRTGSCADAEEQVSKLLASLTPFAAITRLSIRELSHADEGELALAIQGEAQFAKIPQRIFSGRSGRNYPLLPHITLIWEDRTFPQGYFH